MKALEFEAHLAGRDSIQLPPGAIGQIPQGAVVRMILLFDDETDAAIPRREELQLPADGVPDLGVAEEIVSSLGDQSEDEPPDGGKKTVADRCPPVSSSEARLRELAIKLLVL